LPFVGPGHGMALFLSTFVNKIDKKGRVSVPSAFRAALTSQGFPGVVLFPSFSLPAIEGWGMDRMEALSAGIDEDFDPLGNDLDEFANTIFAKSDQLGFDSEGRVMVSEKLLTHARISVQAAFVGRGASFQIWEPGAFQDHQKEAKKNAKENPQKLKLSRKGAEE
jgi:MraZ protein